MFSFLQAASPYLALQAQEKLLAHFLKRSTFEVRNVATNGMNYVVIQNKQKAILNNHPGRAQTAKKTLVMMHGYGAGLGFFYDNFDDYADYYDQIIAVDWLGMGCSDRNARKVPRLHRLHTMLPNHQDCSLQVTRKVIDEFVDGLEELREQENLEEFTLAGHSLGGYLSGQYALKYPDRLNGLILISPPIFTRPVEGAAGREGRVGRTGVYAKFPLDTQFRNMAHRPWSILLIFGEQDWLYYPEASLSVQAWKDAFQKQQQQQEQPATQRQPTDQKPKEGAELLMVPDAGHHLYLENPTFLNRKVIEWVRNEVFR
eukprot:gene10279-7301_t